MSDFVIPTKYQDRSRVVRQLNQGDTDGELWGTFNIDLTTSRGKIKPSKRLTKTLSAELMLNKDVQAFAFFGGDIHAFALGGLRMRIEGNRNLRLSGNWTSTSSDLDIGSESDAVVFGDKLLVSLGDDIAASSNGTSFDDDWWTNVIGGNALTVGKPHIMDVSRSGAETLFVTNGSVVQYYNSSAGHSAVPLPSQQTACCLASALKATWVGTYSSEGNAYVYEVHVGEQLDGSPVARAAYKIDGTAVLSIDVVDGIPYIVTDRGHIQAFNGTGFVTVASFPFAGDSVILAGLSLGNIADANVDRAIHPKGMRAVGKSLLININTTNQLIADLAANPEDDDDLFANVIVNPRSPSGVWEYNSETGVLNHRYSLTLDDTSRGFQKQITSGPILVTNNQFTRILTAGRVADSQTDIFAEDAASAPYGYFITPEIESEVTQDAYEKVLLKVRTMGAGERVVLKWRTSKKASYPQYNDIVWLNATQFTTTDESFANASEGDEVEIVEGYKAGYLAHITAIEAGSTTYTVTIDAELGTLNETSGVRLENWTRSKQEADYGQEDGEFKEIGVGKVNPWVQYKVVLEGNIELREFRSKGNAKQ